MERNKLISFALSFASFLIDRIEVKSIILFGSVAKNLFDKESDIDLFIETSEKNKAKINAILELYKRTKEYEKFKLEGIENEIAIKCGNLDKWKDIKRSIISGGVVLYGSFQGAPKKLKHKILFLLDIGDIDRAKKVKVWRKIYGYRQKVGKKIYISDGFAERKLGKGSFLVSSDSLQLVLDYLKKNNLKYSFFDIWTE